MFIENVAEPGIWFVEPAFASSVVTSGWPLPTVRSNEIGVPAWSVKLRIVGGSSRPGFLAWSSQPADSAPTPGTPTSATGARLALSETGTDCTNGWPEPGTTPARKRAGIWPLVLPPAAVATSRPAARLVDELAPTALLPSTAPALLA